jgi:carboxyl-terminal processing protease
MIGLWGGAQAAMVVRPPPGRPASSLSLGESLTTAARQLVATAAISSAVWLGGGSGIEAAHAYTEFTPSQLIVSEAWKKADNNFVDRTFAGQDWFPIRQKAVKKSYADKSDAYDEIRRILATLEDKYTRFLTPSMYDAIYSVATGDVAGIGVELAAPSESTSDKPVVAISTIVEGAPSDLSGLRAGDVLLDADDNPLLGLSPEEAAAKVRGPVGSKLRLTIRRAGEDAPIVKIIERKSVKLEAVTSSMGSVNGQKVGFVRIKQFSTTTVDDVKKALEGLKGAKAFVFDLRGNTGGYFPGGVDVARLFLKAETPITYVIDKRQQVTTYTTYEDGPYVDTPLVLLVDDKTASASEILSACLQDNGRAKLVGATPKTFGKAVIQTVEQLSDGSAVVVTIAKYETPKRTDINKLGISVDAVRECPAGAAAVQCVSPELKL